MFPKIVIFLGLLDYFLSEVMSHNVSINAVLDWPQLMTLTIEGGMVAATLIMRDIASRLR